MAHVRKAEGMSKRFKDWVQNIGPFLRLRDVLFELLTEIIFQLYHQIANVLFHYTIAWSNWNFFQNNSETKLKTSEMKCKIDSSHWKENGGRAPPRGHFHGQIFSGLLQWCSHVESNAMVWNSFLILGLSSTTELKTIDRSVDPSSWLRKSNASWFDETPSARWSKEIALCPYFDMLNHSGSSYIKNNQS